MNYERYGGRLKFQFGLVELKIGKTTADGRLWAWSRDIGVRNNRPRNDRPYKNRNAGQSTGETNILVEYVTFYSATYIFRAYTTNESFGQRTIVDLSPPDD